MPSRTHRTLLATILGVYLALAVGYGVVTPLFETPDEHLHFFTADFIARERRLPTTLDDGLMGQEAAQPPLYYALGALLITPIDTSDANGQLWANPLTDTPATAGQLWSNPQADPGNIRGESLAHPPINVGMFVHTSDEAWPWQGYALAAHVLRLLSALFGLGTLLAIHAAARLVWPSDPGRALLATGLVAFLPQFAFLHGAVSNDAAITFFAAAAVWQLLRLRLEPPTTGRYLLLGLTIGLTILSKAAGLLMLAYAVGVLGLLAWVQADGRRWAETARAALLIALPALLVGGWLLWRNWTLYGDITAANQFIAIAGGVRPYTLRQVWNDMDRVWLSLFGVFGWMNVQAPAWLYIVWNAIVVAAAAGGLWGLWQLWRGESVAPDPRRALPGDSRFLDLLLHPATILFGWLVLVAAGWLQFMLRTPADQGRLFFPALVALALGTAYGLSRWPRPWVPGAALAAALVTSVYSLFVVIPTAYATPPTVAAVPETAAPLTISFPEGLELLGSTVDTVAARPNDWVWTTLYWRAPGQLPDGAPLAHLELFGRDFERIGQLVAYHGRGNYPATLWPPGAIIADPLAVRVVDWAKAPVLARVTVKLSEETDGVDVGTVKIIPETWPEPAPPVAQLGDAVQVTNLSLATPTAAPGDAITVEITWQVVAPPGPALLHAFVHVGDPTQPPLAQHDGPVMGDVYPAAVWEAGEVFTETITLTLPADLTPGDYPVQLGLYDFAGGGRLPVMMDGQRQPTDTVPVGRLTVTAP
jgi:hypothetical protein